MDMGSDLLVIALDLTSSPQSTKEDDDKDDEIWPAQLDSQVWGRLPVDVLFHSILPRLPFFLLLKLRAVSRSWQSLLSSRDFWRLWFHWNSYLNPNPNPNENLNPNRNSSLNPNPNQNLNPNPNRNRKANPKPYLNQNPCPSANRKPNPKPCLLLCRAHPPFHGPRSRWMKNKSIRFVRPHAPHLTVNTPHSPRSWLCLHRDFPQVQDPFIILCSDGGLLLLALQLPGAQQLIICNPLIKARRELPNPTFPLLLNNSATGLLADAELGEYTVILSGAGSEVYHSTSGRWQPIPKTFFEDPMSSSPPMLDGSFHWFSQQRRWGFNVVTLSAYHAREEIVTSTWTQFPEGISFPRRRHIWKDSQGLQTVAMLSGKVGIWQLSCKLWTEVKPLPPEANEVILQSQLPAFDFIKVGNLLCLSTPNINKVFVYSIDLAKGHWTPHYPHSRHFVEHCAFQPRPDAVV